MCKILFCSSFKRCFKNIKISNLRIFFCIKKTHGFFNINVWDKWKCVSLYFISCFVSFALCISVNYFLQVVRHQTSNRKYLLELNKRSSNVHHQKNMTRERTLTFDQWKTFYGYGFFTKLSTIIALCDLSASSCKLKRDILTLLTKNLWSLENYL